MPATASWITKRKHADGTEACIRDTNINVWGLIARQRRGQDENDILAAIQGLSAADLEAAWAYYRENSEEIDEAIRRNSGMARFYDFCFMKPHGYFSDQWREYRKRRRVAYFFFLVFPFFWLPFTSFYIFGIINLPKKDFFYFIQAFPWVVAVVVSRIWWLLWPCPRCNKPFHASLISVTIYKKFCQHCGLPKWSLPAEEAEEGEEGIQ